MSQTASKVTFDHNEIRRWAEERGAKPACVKGTGGHGDIGMIRLDFPGYSGEESLQPISWEEWFKKFDERNLALLYQETTADGQKSNFNKLVRRETAEQAEASGHSQLVGEAPEAKGAKAGSRHAEGAESSKEQTVKKREKAKAAEG
jgi:hypothetical protein